MASYRYKAIDERGRFHRGRMNAINSADLEMRLSKMELDLVNYRKVRSSGKEFAGSGIKRRDLMTFCFHLEQTLRAGVPIIDSLRDLRDNTGNPRMADVIATMVESIEGGKTLSESMRDFPSVFGDVFTNLISAGEQSGELSAVVTELGENLKWQNEQAAQTKKLLMYPAFVAIVVIAVLLFLMTYLVPELLRFVQTVGQELPAHTRALIVISDIFVHFWYIILSAPFLMVLIIYTGIKTSPAFHLKFDALKLKLPVVGPIMKKIILTRIANSFALMYAAGITIIDCMKAGEKIAGNKAIAEAMRRVGRQISDGMTLSNSFDSVGLFPPLVLRMVRVGESTGSLEESLRNISYLYTRDVKESVERLQAVIEPGMTVVLGTVIAWVMFSVLGPIYDLITKIKI